MNTAKLIQKRIAHGIYKPSYKILVPYNVQLEVFNCDIFFFILQLLKQSLCCNLKSQFLITVNPAGVTYVCIKTFQISYLFIHTTYNRLCIKVSCIICLSSCYINGNEAVIYIKQITNLATIRAVTRRQNFLEDIFELYYMLIFQPILAS